MSEVDILELPFSIKVKRCKVAFSYTDYEKSSEGVQRLLWRTKDARKKTFDPDRLKKIEADIKKLKLIMEDLQKALES
jgi:hypothetical protein